MPVTLAAAGASATRGSGGSRPGLDRERGSSSTSTTVCAACSLPATRTAPVRRLVRRSSSCGTSWLSLAAVRVTGRRTAKRTTTVRACVRARVCVCHICPLPRALSHSQLTSSWRRTDAFDAELATLRTEREQLCEVDTGVKGCVLIALKDGAAPSPDAVVAKLFEELGSKNLPPVREVIRATPLEVTCKGRLPEIIKALTPLLEPHFGPSAPPTRWRSPALSDSL